MAKSSENKLLTPKTMAVSGFLVAALVIVIYLNLGNGPSAPPLNPRENTHDQLARWESELTTFVIREQRLPASLAEANAKLKAVDGWQTPFDFTPGSDGPKKTSYKLRSLGADKLPDTPDDWSISVVFNDDGYGKIGNDRSTRVEPPQ